MVLAPMNLRECAVCWAAWIVGIAFVAVFWLPVAALGFIAYLVAGAA